MPADQRIMTAEPKPSKINILLVDDDEGNLVALEAILQGEGRNLVRAASGSEALHFLLKEDAAVVLLDMRMPGMTGLETAEMIRGLRKTRDLPIIFLTAYDTGDSRDLSTAYSLGAVDFLIKPFDSEVLKSKVAVFVELYKRTEQVKEQAALLHEKNVQLETANFERLGRMVTLGQLLTAERDPKKLLEIFCDAARGILGAEYVNVRMLGSDNESDLIAHNASEPVSVECEEKSLGDRLFKIAVPLGERTLGQIYLHSDTKDFSEADERLGQTLAAQLAVAYENARLHAEAEAANRLKDEFLAVLSHELRTPLNAIVGWTALIKNGLEPARQAHAIETIARNSKMLGRMVEDILDASRMITGKLRLDFIPCDFSQAIKAAADALEPTAEAKRIQLQIKLPAVGSIVMGDSTRLQQIVWNLLSNAIKFTPEQGEISVMLKHSANQARLYVTDSGQGITKEFLPFIFERFRQADSSSTRTNGGLGLGLSLVRHLIDLHGGTISADSKGQNLGSTFVVSLPLAGGRYSSRQH